MRFVAWLNVIALSVRLHRDKLHLFVRIPCKINCICVLQGLLGQEEELHAIPTYKISVRALRISSLRYIRLIIKKIPLTRYRHILWWWSVEIEICRSVFMYFYVFQHWNRHSRLIYCWMWSALVGVYHSVNWKNARWSVKINSKLF